MTAGPTAMSRGHGLADELRAAAMRVSPTSPPSARGIDLDLAEAYAVQQAGVRAKVAAGDRVVGAKVEAGADPALPIVSGVFTSGAIQSAEEPIQTAGLIGPMARTGLVAKLGTDLHGPGVTVADALSAIGAMTCAVEITDSRYGDDGPKASGDLVADNLSIARLVLGPVLRPVADLNLALVGLLCEYEGTLLTTASGAAAPQGHPAAALAALANHLTDRDVALEAGALVYTGSLVPPVRLTPGTEVRATYAYFGSVGVRTR